MCRTEHPQGRYSYYSSVCFPMCETTQQWLCKPVWKLLTFLHHVLHGMSVNKGSKRCHFHQLQLLSITENHLEKGQTPSKKLLTPVCLEKTKLQICLKHSWCSSDSSDDWHLFSLLVIYNSLMNANKAKPQPGSLSHMMDDLLREFHNRLLFWNPPLKTG